MSVRAMALEFPENQTAWYCDRQFMFGESIMLAVAGLIAFCHECQEAREAWRPWMLILMGKAEPCSSAFSLNIKTTSELLSLRTCYT